VFYDRYYEANYLGEAWSDQFKAIFGNDSRYVVCLLDKHHAEKIWPTFERACFKPRVAEGAVIPIFLDDTIFVGIPEDIIGIDFKKKDPTNTNVVTDEIVYRLEAKLRNA
jgi:hypothetical protein